jgi:CheY-like chemotaxis protein
VTARSVLIVDDDADIRSCIREALEDEGYRAAGAVNGVDALRQLREDRLRPDVILLDIMMPEMDGFSFRAEQLEDPELAAIPVLVFTAYGSPRDVAAQLGAAGHLRKPLRLGELFATLDRILG